MAPKLAKLGVRLCFRSVVRIRYLAFFEWRFWLLQAKSNIGQLKIFAAARNAAGTIFPSTFACRSFQAVTRGDPKTVRGLGLLTFTIANFLFYWLPSRLSASAMMPSMIFTSIWTVIR
jgi:hypothetical protein